MLRECFDPSVFRQSDLLGTINMEQQKVWVPCVRDGFTLGVIQDIGSDEATVLRFNDGQVSHVMFDERIKNSPNI